MTHAPTSTDAEPLCAQRHRMLRLVDTDAAFDFARQRQWLPLALAELPHACLDYPCLFQPAPGGHRLVALLGLRRRENLFVDQAGRWAGACWLPAVANAHPFSLEDGDSGPAVLRVVPGSPRLSAVQGRKLFTDDGLPLPLLRAQLALLVECRDELRRASAFAARLSALDLLVARPLHFDNGRLRGQVDGLCQVDEDRLAALPPALLQALHASGDLARVHAHLLSLHQVPRLAHRLAAATAREAARSRWPVATAAVAQAAAASRRQLLTLVA